MGSNSINFVHSPSYSGFIASMTMIPTSLVRPSTTIGTGLVAMLRESRGVDTILGARRVFANIGLATLMVKCAIAAPCLYSRATVLDLSSRTATIRYVSSEVLFDPTDLSSHSTTPLRPTALSLSRGDRSSLFDSCPKAAYMRQCSPLAIRFPD